MRVVPTWDVYFMNIALAVSLRSKDPNAQVGAILVDSNKHIIGTGYNGMPSGTEETTKLWERPTKYDYVVHAEVNALVNATHTCAGAMLFTTLYPCSECAKIIAAAKISKVYYLDNRYENEKTKAIFTRSGITIEQCLLTLQDNDLE